MNVEINELMTKADGGTKLGDFRRCQGEGPPAQFHLLLHQRAHTIRTMSTEHSEVTALQHVGPLAKTPATLLASDHSPLNNTDIAVIRSSSLELIFKHPWRPTALDCRLGNSSSLLFKSPPQCDHNSFFYHPCSVPNSVLTNGLTDVHRCNLHNNFRRM
jgi:hypothetical protein